MGQRDIKVFIASPGDLAIERRAFKDTVDELNKGFGRGADVRFVPLGWEDALSQVGRRSQAVINQDIDVCDVFVLVMSRRWGQEAPDAKPYSSYTEEEFYRALARRENKDADGKRRPVVCVFFKRIDPEFMVDPGDQLKKVLAFRRKLEETKSALYHSFDDDKAFVVEIREHLIAFAQGRFDGLDDERIAPMVPESVTTEIEKHKSEAQRALTELAAIKAEKEQALQEAERARALAKDATARAEAAENVAEAKAAKKSVALAESAAKAAIEGKIEEARQYFAKALDGTTNLRVLYLGYEFFKRIGELDEAERLMRRWLSISGPDQKTVETAMAYGNLGMIELTRGNFDAAEAYLENVLAIGEEFWGWEGMATAYSNLGVIKLTRGNLDAAETYLNKALAIDVNLGREDRMASHYGNLGGIEKRRGNLDTAEVYFKKALVIDENLGRQEGIASHCGNLGGIELTRGNLDAAEAYLKKALVIEEKLGRQEGMADNYSDIGGIELARGDLDAAERYLKKALVIDEKLGRQEGMASDYGNLGVIERTRGNLDMSEAYLKMSLAINEKLGLQEGMANDYGNLGMIEQTRGNKAEALRLFSLSRDLFVQIGNLAKLAWAGINMGRLHADMGEYDTALNEYLTASETARAVGWERGVSVAETLYREVESRKNQEGTGSGGGSTHER